MPTATPTNEELALERLEREREGGVKHFTHYLKAALSTDGVEVVHNGQVGLMISGYMAVWEPRDRGDDNWNLNLTPGSRSRKAIEDYFRKNPVLMYEHGKDPQVGRKALGSAVEYKVDRKGIWVRDFVPRPPEAAALLVDIYNKIKAGTYKTFSIRGKWAYNQDQTIVELADVIEHSVVTVPMMPDATFSLDLAKALAEFGVDEMDLLEAVRLAQSLKAGGDDTTGDSGGGDSSDEGDMGDEEKDLATKTRNKLPKESFVFPDTRTFPIPNPSYVLKAVRAWGLYKGPHSFADFKSRLTALAKRKGAAYSSQLPSSWESGGDAGAGGEKAGRAISAANGATIQQAIDLLHKVISLQQQDLQNEAQEEDQEGKEDDDTQPGQDTTDMTQFGSAGGDEPGEDAKGKVKKPAMNGKASVTISEAREALAYLEGVTSTMDEKDKKTAPVDGQKGDSLGQGSGTVTLSREEYEGLQAVLAAQKAMAVEKEAQEKAAKIEEEAKKRIEAAAQEKAEFDAAVDERVKQIVGTSRSGVKMFFDVPAINPDQYIKHFNVNHGLKDFMFSDLVKSWMAEGQVGMNKYRESVKHLYTSPQEKTMVESVGTAGGFLVPIEQSTQIIDLLRTQAVVRALGANVIKMKRDTMTIPRATGDVTASWVGEGVTMTPSDATFGQATLAVKKLVSVAQLAREVMEDSDPSIESWVRGSIAAAIALKEDDAFLQGAGTNNVPLGVLNTVGINTFAHATGAASAAPELVSLTKASAMIRNQKGKPNGWAMHPRISDWLAQLKDSQGNPNFANVVGGYRWSEMNLGALSRNSNDPTSVELGTLLSYKQALTTDLAISATTSGTGSVVLGDWTKAFIGERQELILSVSDQVGFLNDTIYLKATKRVDFVLAIPEVFTVITGFTAIDVA